MRLDQDHPAVERLPRHLTFPALLFLMLNGIVGAGIFGMPQDVSRIAGSWGAWLFPLCALLILPIILVFAHLGSRFSGTGGPMLYVGKAFGGFAGFQTGWAFYVARLTAFAANINLLVTTLGAFWSGITVTGPRISVLALIIGALVVVNMRSPRGTITTLNLVTIAKFVPLLAIVGAGLWVMPPELSSGTTGNEDALPDIGAAILLVIYAYVGFESGLVPAAEARQPQRDIPRALVGALLIAGALYAALYAVCDRLLPDLAATPRPVVAAGETLFGTAGAIFVTAGIALSVLGNLLGALFSTPRVTYRMALDGDLPRSLATLDPVSSMPTRSIAAFGLLAFLLAASGSFVWLASISVVVRVLIYLGCIAALRRTRGADGLNLPGGFAIPAVAVLVCLYLLSQATLTAWLATLALLLAGTVLWAVARWSARR